MNEQNIVSKYGYKVIKLGKLLNEDNFEHSIKNTIDETIYISINSFPPNIKVTVNCLDNKISSKYVYLKNIYKDWLPIHNDFNEFKKEFLSKFEHGGIKEEKLLFQFDNKTITDIYYSNNIEKFKIKEAVINITIYQ